MCCGWVYDLILQEFQLMYGLYWTYAGCLGLGACKLLLQEFLLFLDLYRARGQDPGQQARPFRALGLQVCRA